MWPSVACSSSRSCSQVRRPLSASCRMPSLRLCPEASSKSFNSFIAVSNDQHLPLRRRIWPAPRATLVSNVNQPSTAFSVSLASPVGVKETGDTDSSCAFSIAAIAARPSIVAMFHVNATRSRQKHSSDSKRPTAASTLRLVSAVCSSFSQASICSAAFDVVIDIQPDSRTRRTPSCRRGSSPIPREAR